MCESKKRVRTDVLFRSSGQSLQGTRKAHKGARKRQKGKKKKRVITAVSQDELRVERGAKVRGGKVERW